MLSKNEQEFIYQLWIDEKLENASFTNGKYELVDRLHKLGVLRKIKSRNSRTNKLVLTDEGFVLAIIVCRVKGDFKNNRNIVQVWYS